MGKTLKAPNTIGLSVKGTPDKGQSVQVIAEDTVHKVFGTKHPETADGLLRHCMKALTASEASDDLPANDERTFMVAAVADVDPRDGVESMLAVQMAATHVALVRSSRWLAGADTIEQVKAHYSGFTKLSRAYAAQMEALRKHRNGGKQTVTVQHVNVEGGGQAIVGNVQTGEGRA